MQNKPKSQSAFVRRIMKGASEQEIEEATERWFQFLELLNQIVEVEKKSNADS